MRQGEIWTANLNPTRGSEQQGLRPVVIISGNLLNQNTPLCIICPLTSKLKYYQGNVILIPDNINKLKLKSEVLTFQIRSVAKERMIEKIGDVTLQELNLIKSCLQDILRY